MQNINTRFVIACRKGRRRENKPVPIIGAGIYLTRFRPKLGCSSLGHEFVINEELYLQTPREISGVNCPAGNCLHIGLIDRSAYVSIRRDQIEHGRHCDHNDRLNDRLADQNPYQAGA